MKRLSISRARLSAMINKEFSQVKRDPTVIIMIILVPFIQLILFGYAINTTPKNMPMALIDFDRSEASSVVATSFANSGYFNISRALWTPQQTKQEIEAGHVQFVLTIPHDFSTKIHQGLKPQLLLQADATDPVATSGALGALAGIEQQINQLIYHKPYDERVTTTVHRLYNPKGSSQLSIVPGLIGAILIMSLVMTTSMSMTKEREYGTLELLLATPLSPLEVMLGKMIPFIVVGYLQIAVILLMAVNMFSVPIHGSLLALLLLSLPFVIANLSVGITVSTFSANQLEAANTGVVYFLPSLLLSGFLFPFYGMPQWAQTLGSWLPLTHYINICRAIMLKGAPALSLLDDIWPMIAFMLVLIFVAVLRYRTTLD